MNHRGPILSREDNTVKPKTFIKDSEHSVTYSPQSHPGNKFFGMQNKALGIPQMLLWENKEKYLNEF